MTSDFFLFQVKTNFSTDQTQNISYLLNFSALKVTFNFSTDLQTKSLTFLLTFSTFQLQTPIWFLCSALDIFTFFTLKSNFSFLLSFKPNTIGCFDAIKSGFWYNLELKFGMNPLMKRKMARKPNA